MGCFPAAICCLYTHNHARTHIHTHTGGEHCCGYTVVGVLITFVLLSINECLLYVYKYGVCDDCDVCFVSGPFALALVVRCAASFSPAVVTAKQRRSLAHGRGALPRCSGRRRTFWSACVVPVLSWIHSLSRSASAPTPRSISEPASVFHRHLLPPRSLLAPSTIDPSAPPPHCSLMYHPLSLSFSPLGILVCVYESYTVRGSLFLPISLPLTLSFQARGTRVHCRYARTTMVALDATPSPPRFHPAPCPSQTPLSFRFFPNATQIVYNFRKTVNTHIQLESKYPMVFKQLLSFHVHFRRDHSIILYLYNRHSYWYFSISLCQWKWNITFQSASCSSVWSDACTGFIYRSNWWSQVAFTFISSWPVHWMFLLEISSAW